MKKWFSFLLVCLCLGCLFASVRAEDTDQPTVTLDREEVTLYRERAVRLTATVTNADLRTVRVIWSSSDESIATVSSGTVMGRDEGSTVITCTVILPDGTEISDSCLVEVLIPVSGIRLSVDALTLFVGRAGETVGYTVQPEAASNHEVRWVSSDESVATVDATGTVTPHKAGRTTVTAISEDDPGKKANVAVTVLQPVTSITFREESMELAAGKTGKLIALIEPENASYQRVSWSSSDASVVSVQNGVLTAKKQGTATVTCTADDGSGTVGSCEIEVYTPVSGVSVSPATLKLFIDADPVQLNAAVKPENAKYREVTWSSSDGNVVSVDATGSVTPTGLGTATVTVVSSDDPTKKASVTVKVLRPVESITLNMTGGEVEKGKGVKLTADVLPGNASDKKVVWTSSDPAVASVSEGTVNAKKTGTAVITATAADGSGVSASYTVTVIQKVTGLKFAKTTAAVSEGKTKTLTVNVSPKDASEKKVTWSSSAPEIAAVDSETGVVTAVRQGSCTVTARATDGSGKTATVTVVVEPAVPLRAVSFNRSGKYNAAYRFEAEFESLTRVTSIRALVFTLEYAYADKVKTVEFRMENTNIGAGDTAKTGWKDVGYQLTYSHDFRIILNAVMYADGSWDYFEDTVIGTF